jgi:hypothetical protein
VTDSISAATVLVVLAVIAVAGYLPARLFASSLSLPERLGWGMASGLTLLSLASAGMMAVGLVPGPKKLNAGLLLVAAGSLLLARRRSTGEVARIRGTSPAVVAIALLAFGGVLFFAVQATAGPMWVTDHLAIWGLKAKTIFVTASIPNRLFHDPALEWSNPAYPLLVPLSLSSVAAAVRGWDGRSLALLYPFWQLATLFVVSGFVGRRSEPLAGALAGLLCAWCLPLYAPPTVGTAEIPMALSMTLVSTAFLDLLERDCVEARIRLCLAATLAAATKAEGSLFVLLLLVPVVAYRHRIARTLASAAAACLVLPVLSHALVLRFLRGSVPGRSTDWSLLEPGRWVELAERLGKVAVRLFRIEVLGGALALFALAVFLAVTRRSFADLLLLPVCLLILAYAFAAALSRFDPVWQVASAFARITVTLFPVAAVILGGRMTATFSAPTDAPGELAPS